MREKIQLEAKGGRYVVRGLVNRTEPHIGKALSEEEVQALVQEAKWNDLQVVIK
jgi:hypothetical protein